MRFHRFFMLYQKRRIIETLERQKDEMIAALWSNSAWDEGSNKDARKNAISGINDSFGEAVEAVEDALMQKDRPEEEKLSNDNPFFAATERGLSKVEQRVKAQGKEVQSIEHEDEIDYMKDLDQK